MPLATKLVAQLDYLLRVVDRLDYIQILVGLLASPLVDLSHEPSVDQLGEQLVSLWELSMVHHDPR